MIVPAVGSKCNLPCVGWVKCTSEERDGIFDVVAESNGRAFPMTVEAWNAFPREDDREVFIASWDEGDCPRFGWRELTKWQRFWRRLFGT